MAGLIRFLAVKSVLETLFVLALVLSFYITAFHPSFRGALDIADRDQIKGWALDRSNPGKPVEIQVFINGRFVAAGTASLSRPDVVAAGLAAEGNHGFAFQTPELPPGSYHVRAYAVHSSGNGTRQTLQEIGQPHNLEVH